MPAEAWADSCPIDCPASDAEIVPAGTDLAAPTPEVEAAAATATKSVRILVAEAEPEQSARP